MYDTDKSTMTESGLGHNRTLAVLSLPCVLHNLALGEGMNSYTMLINYTIILRRGQA